MPTVGGFQGSAIAFTILNSDDLQEYKSTVLFQKVGNCGNPSTDFFVDIN